MSKLISYENTKQKLALYKIEKFLLLNLIKQKITELGEMSSKS
jgi:hypothetical protein